MSHVVRNDVSVVGCGLVFEIGDFEDGMGETLINMVLQWISLEDVVTDTQIDR